MSRLRRIVLILMGIGAAANWSTHGWHWVGSTGIVLGALILAW